jgi:lantibiotic modifying enzyme
VSARDDALEVALRIGIGLAREAIWYEDRCNWIGPAPDPEGSTAFDECISALDPYLYAGTGGVALFLGELHGATGERELHRAALGAGRQALRAATRSGPPRLGLYDGAVGVAVVAARLAHLLSEPALAGAARALLDTLPLTDSEADQGESDLLAGAAGTAVGLLIVSRLLGARELVGVATALGERVLARGERPPGLSWPSASAGGGRNLTGLAHGAAGIAHALLALADATGRVEFAEAADGAFEYERAVFDHAAGNWPDFRSIASVPGSAGPSYAAFWCHGGPGIALVRSAAWERAGDARPRSEAEVGLAVARDAVTASLRHGGGNFSLCHGLAGNAEILLEGARVLGARDGDGEHLAFAVAALGAERHARAGDWPSGLTSGRPSPGLMLGRAGTGYFYLRLARPSVASVLLPRVHPP